MMSMSFLCTDFCNFLIVLGEDLIITSSPHAKLDTDEETILLLIHGGGEIHIHSTLSLNVPVTSFSFSELF